MNFLILIGALVLLTTGLANVNADLPPQVKVHEIGTDYIVFDVSGANMVDHLPTMSIDVIYRLTNTGEKPTTIQHNSTWSGIKKTNVQFERFINVTNLDSGLSYEFQFYLSNNKKEHGPISPPIDVLLRPQTPDFSITHIGQNEIQFFWGYPNTKQIDYFLLTIEKESSPGCGFTLNFTRCYGNNYKLTSLQDGQSYIFKFSSHNPSGFSDTVQVYFPYE